jgi:hypothetical protein
MNGEFERKWENNGLHESRKSLKINNCLVNVLKQEKVGEMWRGGG